MANVLTIADTKKMSKTKIEVKLAEYAKELENLGMDHVSACEFLSSIMNLGIAAHEKLHNTTRK